MSRRLRSSPAADGGKESLLQASSPPSSPYATSYTRQTALQFVPAYEESMSPTPPKGASWDVLVEEKKEGGVSPSSPTRSSRLAKAKTYQKQRKSATAAASSSLATSPATDVVGSKKGPRLARLANLFNSRATVSQDTQPQQRKATVAKVTSPPSPSQSNSSTGYVGWPGTQNRMGDTVLPASFDEEGPQDQPAWTPFGEAGWKTPSSTDDIAHRPRRSLDAYDPPSPSKRSTPRYAQSDVGVSNSSSRIRSVIAASRERMQSREIRAPDPWVPSSPGGSSASKSSSAYMQETDAMVTDNAYRAFRRSRTEEIVRKSTAPRPPTADALAVNDHLSPPHRSIGGTGYLLDKTKDVPSLMDAVDSDSIASSRATSTFSGARSKREAESDVFDNLSKDSDVFDNLSNPDGRSSLSSPRKPTKSKASYPERIAEEVEHKPQSPGDIKLVTLGGGLTTIQTTNEYFSNRQTASDFDENLTNSEVDQNGFAKLPGFHEMVSAGHKRDSALRGIQGNIGQRRPEPSPSPPEDDYSDTDDEESTSSLFTDPYELGVDDGPLGDLSMYYVHPFEMKKLLRKYRKMSDKIDNRKSLAQFEREEDEDKAFALLEMRSRIMEKDIERGLERCGGTVVVDDLVTTPSNMRAHRVRDAVIVSKAWRDGASPADVINTAQLTSRDLQYYIRRPVRTNRKVNESSSSLASTTSKFYWEPVRWVDDADFMQYRCPSLGPRHMRGVEMFTVGDCQSILLKLCNERCMDLRHDLNDATRRQIEAEDWLKEEGEAFDGMMTEAEMEYLAAMEEVKTISKKLVNAEKAFTLVRDRIEQLVYRYEDLLNKIDTESFTGASSVVTYESSFYSEHNSEYWDEQEARERAVWSRRAKRAEVRAELAAREALLAKQETRMLVEEKQRELERLEQKLLELKSEASQTTDARLEAGRLARSFEVRSPEDRTTPVKEQFASPSNKERLEGVKQRFRDRMAMRKQTPTTPSTATPDTDRSSINSMSQRRQQHSPSPQVSRALFRAAGEEMCSHLGFYEKVLTSVETSRGGS